MHHTYILYSETLDKYYVGNTDLDPEDRLLEHNAVLHNNAFTKKGVPWELKLVLICTSRLQARRVETHIKKMKSRKYIENLQAYDDMQNRLIQRFRVVEQLRRLPR